MRSADVRTNPQVGASSQAAVHVLHAPAPDVNHSACRSSLELFMQSYHDGVGQHTQDKQRVPRRSPVARRASQCPGRQNIGLPVSPFLEPGDAAIHG